MIHPWVTNLNGSILKREAVRAIVLSAQSILLLYTRRYNDYSLPGGGVNQDESHEAGLVRELQEETGAQNISLLQGVGYLEEFRPWHKPEFDIMHMISHYYICQVDHELGQTQMEEYEEKNGMTPIWINIYEAIDHNQKVIDRKESSMGLSIERETFMLRKIAEELI